MTIFTFCLLKFLYNIMTRSSARARVRRWAAGACVRGAQDEFRWMLWSLSLYAVWRKGSHCFVWIVYFMMLLLMRAWSEFGHGRVAGGERRVSRPRTRGPTGWWCTPAPWTPPGAWWSHLSRCWWRSYRSSGRRSSAGSLTPSAAAGATRPGRRRGREEG